MKKIVLTGAAGRLVLPADAAGRLVTVLLPAGAAGHLVTHQ